MEKAKKILIVDDSSLLRKIVKSMLEKDNSLIVAGEAENGLDALEKLSGLSPDVVLLDVNMPVMDGITALKHIMVKSPRPTVMFSTFTRKGAITTFEALKCGAVDFIEKPSSLKDISLEDQGRALLSKVHFAADVKVKRIKRLKNISPDSKIFPKEARWPKYIFALAGAEGSLSSLMRILPGLDPTLNASFILVLYEEPEHVDVFASYLDGFCRCRVKRALNGAFLESGVCYLASGKEYVTLVGRKHRKGFALRVQPSAFPNRRGAANMLMFSVAEAMEKNAVGLVLSGMGDDGVEGFQEIGRLGGKLMVQAPESCLCEEMVQSALLHSKVNHTFPDSEIVDYINGNFMD